MCGALSASRRMRGDARTDLHSGGRPDGARGAMAWSTAEGGEAASPAQTPRGPTSLQLPCSVPWKFRPQETVLWGTNVLDPWEWGRPSTSALGAPEVSGPGGGWVRLSARPWVFRRPRGRRDGVADRGFGQGQRHGWWAPLWSAWEAPSQTRALSCRLCGRSQLCSRQKSSLAKSAPEVILSPERRSSGVNVTGSPALRGTLGRKAGVPV